VKFGTVVAGDAMRFVFAFEIERERSPSNPTRRHATLLWTAIFPTEQPVLASATLIS
jgi:hypothetical protein